MSKSFPSTIFKTLENKQRPSTHFRFLWAHLNVQNSNLGASVSQVPPEAPFDEAV